MPFLAMRPSSLSNTSTIPSPRGSLHAPQHQSQDDPVNVALGPSHLILHLDTDREKEDEEEGGTDDDDSDDSDDTDNSGPGSGISVTEYEPSVLVDGQYPTDLPSPASSSSPSSLMTADPVAVGTASGSVQRPALAAHSRQQSYIDGDNDATMTDAEFEVQSDSDSDLDDNLQVDVDVDGGAPLALSSAAATAGAETLDHQVNHDSEFDSEYDSEDEYVIQANEYHSQLPAMQPFFPMIPTTVHHLLMAGQQLTSTSTTSTTPPPHTQTQTQPPPQQLPQNPDTDTLSPHNLTQLNADIPELANLPPLPQPPPDWVPLPPILGDTMPNLLPSNANPSILGSENLGLVDFLRDWAYQGRFGRAARSQPPYLEQVVQQAQAPPDEVDYSDLEGDACDIQGLDWSAMETTRQAARLRRQYTYRNYVNRHGSDKWATLREGAFTSSNSSFVRFKRMDIRKDISLAHFQLRSVLACPTRTHAYYPSRRGITRLNTASRKSDLAMNLLDFPANGAVVSTLDADCGILMCGTFNGDYCMKSLDSNDKQAYTEGRITHDISGITNHIKIHKPRRSAGPAAAIASNDHGLRLLDLETQKFTQETIYPFALNCTAVSPDRRLRAIVGDDFNVFITNADTGEVQRELSGHRDYGFACDWSDDGWTVATGFQDMAVKIWDARRWCNSSGVSTPLHTVRTEMAGARSLRFSPLGGGRPVLVAAEEADYVNVIDAKTFERKQLVDVFGEIGGVSFANDGHDLNVLCCDAHRGGLVQLERCGRDVDVPFSKRKSITTPGHEMPEPF